MNIESTSVLPCPFTSPGEKRSPYSSLPKSTPFLGSPPLTTVDSLWDLLLKAQAVTSPAFIVLAPVGEHHTKRVEEEEAVQVVVKVKREQQSIVGDQLRFIEATLSLALSDISQILSVSRQTIHAWVNGREPHKNETLDRLQQLYLVAKDWSPRSSEPLGIRTRTLIGAHEKTLIQLLREEPFDTAAIKRLLDSWASLAKEQQAHYDQNTYAPGSVRDILQRHNLPARRRSLPSDDLDTLTGSLSFEGADE